MLHDDAWIRATVWLYSRLLALYPPSFQARYGREMALVFRDICRREKHRNGLGGLMALWFESIVDLASTALQEHLREFGMLTQRESFIRLTGLLGFTGGVLGIVVGLLVLGEFGQDPSGFGLVLWVLAHLFIALGTMGFFVAGRHQRDINAGLGIMLVGALVAALGGLLMSFEIDIGWGLWPGGWLLHGLGLIVLGMAARKHGGFLPLDWLPGVLGAATLVLLVATMASETTSTSTFSILLFVVGGGWALLGLLLLSGRVGADEQPPAVA